VTGARALRRLAIALALIIGPAGNAPGAEVAQVGTVTIHDPWARASIGNAPNSAAYLTLETTGAEPDRLVASSSPVAAQAALHSHAMDGGVARMRPVDAVEVAPGAPTVLAPGGVHIMLIGLRQKLAPGDSVPLTLVFEHAGAITIEAPVRGMTGTRGHGAHGHGATGEDLPESN
jgi:copper(I)-binding protein